MYIYIIYIYIIYIYMRYIHIYISQTMVTANNYMHNILHSPQPFSLDVQPHDGLLEAETCSC